ncbi:hypothetical protein MXD59_11135 [Frankia sp. Ag45/Mut15]|uniref:Uncharacterized protein n=1 Tax=Frankia umida TaxID=573489 RepID=A0ABT0JXQ6_9ACTN|nr:hypothetical protein [Frankia umida]MCK9876322.1 hypothetical protein [Frankia umida]
MTPRPARPRGAAYRRVLTVAGLAMFTVPVFAATASAAEIGTKYNPDPLTVLQTWGIYGGAIAGGFLIAILLAAWSGRRSGPTRYRPGQAWEHDDVWVGKRPEELEGAREEKAVPGAGGASGNW